MLGDYLRDAHTACATQNALPRAETRLYTSALCNLSRCYLAIYLFSSRPLRIGDLDTSISKIEDAISLSRNSDVDLSYYVLQRVFALVVRLTLTQVVDDLDQAVNCLTLAVESLPERHPLTPRCLGLLGSCLYVRFKVIQAVVDLPLAVSLLYQALICRPKDTGCPFWSRFLLKAEYYERHGQNFVSPEPTLTQFWQEDIFGSWCVNDPYHINHWGRRYAEALFISPVPRCVVGKMSTLTTVFEAGINYGNEEMCVKLLDEASRTGLQLDHRFEWIKEPLSMGFTATEVVNLLVEGVEQSPWIYYAPPRTESRSVNPAYHRPGCIHRYLSRPGPGTQYSAKLISRAAKRTISESCGLAGIIPENGNRTLWNGKVDFFHASSSAKINYGTPEEKSSSNGAERSLRMLLQCCDALNNILQLIGWLQQENLVCDHLIILAHNLKNDTIQSTVISFRLVEELKTCLKEITSARTTQDLVAWNKLLDAALRILVSTSVLKSMPESLQGRQIIDYALDSSAIAVQMICLGFLSFSQAHIGDLVPFFLERALSTIFLGGAGGQLSQDLNLSLRPANLSCIGDMLGCSVMAFMSDRTSKVDKIHNFQTSVKVLSDLWGPIELEQDISATVPGNFSGIKIGGGVIHIASHDSSMFHWSPGTPEISFTKEGFTLNRSMVIGSLYATNQGCPAMLNQHSTVPRKNIRKEIKELGTWPDTWTLQQIQAGFQAGQFFNPTFNATWIKRDRRSLKKKGLGDIALDFLDQPWGLLVSACTGVAHRVPLREVVAEVMTPMMAAWMEKPAEWPTLNSTGSGILSEMRKSTFRSWVASLSSKEQHAVSHCVRYVLRKICWTGVNDRIRLVVSCPSFEQSDGCVHVPLRENHALAGILRDTEDSATFVCLTTKCFITDQCSCQHSDHPEWRNEISVLVTSVCQFKWLGADDWDLLPRKDLENGKLYWMGSRQDKARFVAEVNGRQGCSTVLKLSKSQTPWPFFLRAYERVERLRPYYVALR